MGQDIAANGFWGGRYERTFFDVRVFNPHAGSNRQTSLAACYRKHEAIKKRAYEQRVREVEHSSFTPLVLSATGGLATEATTFYKRLSACLADKWEQSTPPPWPGSAAALPSLFSGQLYNAFEVLDQELDMHQKLCRLLTSSQPRWT